MIAIFGLLHEARSSSNVHIAEKKGGLLGRELIACRVFGDSEICFYGSWRKRVFYANLIRMKPCMCLSNVWSQSLRCAFLMQLDVILHLTRTCSHDKRMHGITLILPVVDCLTRRMCMSPYVDIVADVVVDPFNFEFR